MNASGLAMNEPQQPTVSNGMGKEYLPVNGNQQNGEMDKSLENGLEGATAHVNDSKTVRSLSPLKNMLEMSIPPQYLNRAFLATSRPPVFKQNRRK